MEDEFDRHQFQRLARQFERNRINELQMVRSGERAPGIFFGRKIEVHDRPVLGQVETALASPDLFQLLVGKLARFQQKIARFFLVCVYGLRHISWQAKPKRPLPQNILCFRLAAMRLAAGWDSHALPRAG